MRTCSDFLLLELEVNGVAGGVDGGLRCEWALQV